MKITDDYSNVRMLKTVSIPYYYIMLNNKCLWVVVGNITRVCHDIIYTFIVYNRKRSYCFEMELSKNIRWTIIFGGDKS